MKIDFRDEISVFRNFDLKNFLRYLAQKSGLDTTPQFLVKFFCTRTTIPPLYVCKVQNGQKMQNLKEPPRLKLRMDDLDFCARYLKKNFESNC